MILSEKPRASSDTHHHHLPDVDLADSHVITTVKRNLCGLIAAS